MPLAPLVLEPIEHPRAWGHELWLLADLPAHVANGRSRIARGEHAGLTLHDLLDDARLRASILGRAHVAEHGGFPLLVKILDAREDLSVQVHPSAAYAANHPDAHVKSEMWLVLDAKPGAHIYRGIRHGIGRADLERLIREDRALDAMLVIDAKPGDCVYLPSGTCHALGAGIRVAEVQTPSDTTFRVWDWGRHDPRRPLHIEQALECMSLGVEQQLDAPPSPAPIDAAGTSIQSLVRTPDFSVERVRILPGATLHDRGTGTPAVWMLIDGGIGLPGAGHVQGPAAILMPADRPPLEATSAQGATLLLIRLPDPLLDAAPASPAHRA
jgi:mannose-6-phosphate isomerase